MIEAFRTSQLGRWCLDTWIGYFCYNLFWYALICGPCLLILAWSRGLI